MSKPDLDIIHSPTAKTFLRSVTEGFYNRSYVGLWIYEVIGREWDEMAGWSNDLKQEIFVQTCTWSIGIWEWVYGFEPDESMTLEERRQRILSKILGVRPINPEVLRRGIAAVSGADAGVTDFTDPYSFGVALNITNKPIPIDRVLQYIYDHKPAHLSVSVQIIFPKIESTLHIGSSVGNRAEIPVPEKADEYDFKKTLYTGGSVGAADSIHIPQRRDEYEFLGTLHTGGTIEAATSISVPKRQDEYNFRDVLHTGGGIGEEASVSIPDGPESPDFRSALHTGGSPSIQAALPIPDDTSPPSSTTILRTGGVCTIISNLSSKGE